MELHAILIGGWYLYGMVAGFIATMVMKRARVTDTKNILVAIISIIMVASIFATGDPSSWQAVFLMLWWALNVFYSFVKGPYSERLPDHLGARFLAGVILILIQLPLFFIGINIPSGG